MFNPFQPLQLIKTEVFMSMPAKFRKKSRTAWSDPNRQGAEVECFLEGPSFDRDGNLWFVDIPFGRIFRITPKKDWELVTQYDGWPNGLKIHKDGRIFICDYKEGLLVPGSEDGQDRNHSAHRVQRRLQGPERSALRRQRRPVFHRPGADRHRRSDRARLSPRHQGPARPPVRQRAEPERHHAVDDRQARVRRRHALAADLAAAADGRRQPSKTGVAIQLSGGVGGPTASRWMPRTGCSCASSASASGASTATCCRRT